MEKICIRGTGKMALNTGLYFIRKGYGVTWVSDSKDYLEKLRLRADKAYKILRKYFSNGSDILTPSFSDSSERNIPKQDVLLECTNESAAKKREAISKIEHAISGDTILLSNSSSILPSRIHPQAFGCHFFYPVQLTECVEMICRDDSSASEKAGVLTFLSGTGLSVIKQTEKNAFAVNRLLLPLQNKIFGLISKGYPADVLDEASSLPVMQKGQISFMDSVGPDVVYASVLNYISEMPMQKQHEYRFLKQGLKKVIDSKTGSIKDLFEGNQPGGAENKDKTIRELNMVFTDMFTDTCRLFLKEKQMEKHDLELILANIYQSEITVNDIYYSGN